MILRISEGRWGPRLCNAVCVGKRKEGRWGCGDGTTVVEIGVLVTWRGEFASTEGWRDGGFLAVGLIVG